jgi:hypothetical protein
MTGNCHHHEHPSSLSRIITSTQLLKAYTHVHVCGRTADGSEVIGLAHRRQVICGQNHLHRRVLSSVKKQLESESDPACKYVNKRSPPCKRYVRMGVYRPSPSSCALLQSVLVVFNITMCSICCRSTLLISPQPCRGILTLCRAH